MILTDKYVILLPPKCASSTIVAWNVGYKFGKSVGERHNPLLDLMPAACMPNSKEYDKLYALDDFPRLPEDLTRYIGDRKIVVCLRYPHNWYASSFAYSKSGLDKAVSKGEMEQPVFKFHMSHYFDAQLDFEDYVGDMVSSEFARKHRNCVMFNWSFFPSYLFRRMYETDVGFFTALWMYITQNRADIIINLEKKDELRIKMSQILGIDLHHLFYNQSGQANTSNYSQLWEKHPELLDKIRQKDRALYNILDNE